MMFIDLEKAYDKVRRGFYRSVPMTYIRVIKDMYVGTKTRVKTMGRDSKYFLVMMGLHQRSTLSLFLFASVTDELTQLIQG